MLINVYNVNFFGGGGGEMEYKIKTTEITNEGVHYFKKNSILSR